LVRETQLRLEVAQARHAGTEMALAQLEARRAETEARLHETEARRVETEARRAETETRLHETEARRAETETRLQETELRRTETETRLHHIETHRVEIEARLVKIGRTNSGLRRQLHDSGLVVQQLAERLNLYQVSSFRRLLSLLLWLEAGMPRMWAALFALPKLLWWTVTFRISQRLRLKAAARRVLKSGLFEPDWYLARNPDVVLAGHIPVYHWLTRGWREGRDPGPLFDTDWYLEHNPEIRADNEDPVQHYLRTGALQGCDPNPLFDSDWYLARYPDVMEAGLNPLIHYIRWGAREGRDPHSLFDTDWYLKQNADLLDSAMNPLAHYLHWGGAEQRNPSPLFDTARYLAVHPEVADAGLNPLVHFLSQHEAQEPASDNEAEAASDPTVYLHAPWDPSEFNRAWAATDEALRVSSAEFQPAERHLTAPEAFQPCVTVVVPNYNHAPYLRQRLDSIYAQSYRNFRVLLLDDCSSDESRSILEEYAAAYSDNTTTLFNAQNSGGPFLQWLRGIECADSELVWIAESDDYCDENFLEKLVPFFMDEAVMLAYARSEFVDEQGAAAQFRFEDYLHELSNDKWSKNYVATAHQEVRDFLGKKNTIPNVSSALFRKCRLAQLFADPEWLKMRICGDWLFYLHLLRGGKIAFSTQTRNYFRFHSANSSAKTYATADYYREHEAVACTIARLYDVPDETFAAHRAFVERFFHDNAAALKARRVKFGAVYNRRRIEKARKERLPNLLIASFAFAVGGGEVFPIRLANALRERGFAVSFLDYHGEEVNPRMRTTLDPGIPVLERNYWFPGVVELARDFGLEIVHTHHGSVDEFFAVASSHESIPLAHVVTMHGMYEAMPRETFLATWDKVGDRVDAWVYIAEKNLAPFIEEGIDLGTRALKIPNGMSMPTPHPPPRATLDIGDDAFVLCLASRAIPAKGWRESIEITTEARRLSARDVHLLLLGDGPVYDAMRSETLPAYVHLLGFVSNVVDYFAMADLGFLPTTFEGESFPLTLIECLMAGRPVLASEVGEIANMLTSENGEIAGFLIDIGDGEIPLRKTAEQVAALATDPELYSKKQRLAAEIAPRFAMDEVVDRYVEVYRKTQIGKSRPNSLIMRQKLTSKTD
ncbi:MAG: glycosyltransferase, partial [Gammaproteobacteria bacterium]